jgi:hypothetical protein
MEFKFKRGNKVHILFGEIFSSTFGGDPLNNRSFTGEGLKITSLRNHNGVAQYKVEGFTGWWNEDNLQEA